MIKNNKVIYISDYKKSKEKKFDVVAFAKRKLEEKKAVEEIIKKSKNLDW